jgi:hypothetical protein
MPSAEELFRGERVAKSENVVLRAQIEWLRSRSWGRKSEKLADAQLT